jgi:hypothetical protein
MSKSFIGTKVVGIYKILHSPTHSIYIGQSNNIYTRFEEHKKELNLSTHHNSYLQSVWNKSNDEEFIFSILEVAPNGLTPLQTQRWLAEKEKIYIEYHQKNSEFVCLNIMPAEIVKTRLALEEFSFERNEKKKAEAIRDLERDSYVKSERKRIKERLEYIDAVLNAKRPEQDALYKSYCEHQNLLSEYEKKHTGVMSIFNGSINKSIISSYKKKIQELQDTYYSTYGEFNKLLCELKLEKEELIKMKNKLKSAKQLKHMERNLELSIGRAFGRNFKFDNDEYK